MAVAPEVAIEVLKERSNVLQVELQEQQKRTQWLHANNQQAEQDVAKLRSQVAEAAAEGALQNIDEEWALMWRIKMSDENERLDAEATTVSAVKGEMEEHRAKVANLLAQMHSVRDSTSAQIEEALSELRSASSARVAQATSEWRSEKEVLCNQILTCKSELSSLRVEAEEARQRVRHLKRRTAAARLGRAAAAWQHELAVKGVWQKARREKASLLRKLAREREEIEKEVARHREALNREIRQAELADTRARKDRKNEFKALQDELEQLEDRIEAIEGRMRQEEILAKTVDLVPQSEGDRIRKWAEAAGGAGSVNFLGAAHRLHRRALMPGLDGEDDDTARVELGGGRRPRAGGYDALVIGGSASAPTLPRLTGGLRQLEEQIQGCRR